MARPVGKVFRGSAVGSDVARRRGTDPSAGLIFRYPSANPALEIAAWVLLTRQPKGDWRPSYDFFYDLIYDELL
jgi:hypothetical protein